MTIRFKCPSCGEKCNADEKLAGRPFACPKCKQRGVIPAAAAVLSAAPLPIGPPATATRGQPGRGQELPLAPPPTPRPATTAPPVDPAPEILDAEPVLPGKFSGATFPQRRQRPGLGRRAGRALQVAGRALWAPPRYYWVHFGALKSRFQGYTVRSEASTEPPCEIRLSAFASNKRARYVGDRWEVELPECCVVCGDEAPETGGMEELRGAADVTRPLWISIAGLLLGLVGLIWHWSLLLIASVAGAALGHLVRREVPVQIRYRRCADHQTVSQFPGLSGFDGTLLVGVGNKRVKNRFHLPTIIPSDAPQLAPPDATSVEVTATVPTPELEPIHLADETGTAVIHSVRVPDSEPLEVSRTRRQPAAPPLVKSLAASAGAPQIPKGIQPLLATAAAAEPTPSAPEEIDLSALAHMNPDPAQVAEPPVLPADEKVGIDLNPLPSSDGPPSPRLRESNPSGRSKTRPTQPKHKAKPRVSTPAPVLDSSPEIADGYDLTADSAQQVPSLPHPTDGDGRPQAINIYRLPRELPLRPTGFAARTKWWQIAITHYDIRSIQDLDDLRRMLLAGEITRHTIHRELYSEPQQKEDNEDAWEAEQSEWRKRTTWKPVGEGVARDHYSIRVLYDPMGAHAQVFSEAVQGAICVVAILALFISEALTGFAMFRAVFGDFLDAIPGPLIFKAGIFFVGAWLFALTRAARVFSIVGLPIGLAIGFLVGSVRGLRLPRPPDDAYLMKDKIPIKDIVLGVVGGLILVPTVALLGTLGYLWATGQTPRQRAAATAVSPEVLQGDKVSEGKWRDFVDAGGRFRCRVPADWTANQVEADTRSKVQFKSGSITMGALARPSSEKPIAQADVETLAATLEKSAKAGFPASRITIESKSLVTVDDSPAADVALSTSFRSQTARSRNVKYRKHGIDHVLTLLAPEEEFDKARKVFDEFVQSYRSIAPEERAGQTKERKLPAELDAPLDEPQPAKR